MDRELMQQALEALERYGGVDQRACDAEEALRERLAQQEQELVDRAEKAAAFLDARLWEFIDMAAAWPEAKPDPRIWGHVMVYAPKQPSKPWQGLTDEEINSVRYKRDWTAPWTDLAFARVIEAKLKERNG